MAKTAREIPSNHGIEGGQSARKMAPLRSMTSPVHAFDPTPEMAKDLRRAFGRFGTGVTVVTTHTEAGPLGITANSFSSVSLDPPLVLWSQARDSRRHDAFVTAAHFCIHVLGADQRDLAQRFARQGHDFDGLSWQSGQGGAPVFPDCLATFECNTHAVHPAGDHSLIIGEIIKVTVARHDGPGLLFDQGRYGRFHQTD